MSKTPAQVYYEYYNKAGDYDNNYVVFGFVEKSHWFTIHDPRSMTQRVMNVVY